MGSCIVLVLCALTITWQIHDASAWSFEPATLPLLKTTPPSSRFAYSTTVLCQADTPLENCHVNLLTKGTTYAPMGHSLGKNSGYISVYNILNDELIYDIKYHGTGLKKGQCGAVYSLVAPIAVVFGCRGSNAAKEWHDMNLVLANSSGGAVPATISPLVAIAKPGDDVSIVLHSEPMLSCTAMQQLRGKQMVLSPSSKQQTDGTYRYFGVSPLHGDCGVTLLNVSEIDNGPLSIMGITSNDRKVAQLMSIVIIAAPPAEVSLSVNQVAYSEKDGLRAECSSLLSRPVSNLTWILDGKIIRQDAKRDRFEDYDWSWPWEMQNITQRISFSVKPEHFGMKLECRVQHLDNAIANPHYVIKRV